MLRQFMKDVECHSRSQWADYFDQKHVHYAFYSAIRATARQQARREAESSFSSDESENGASRNDHDLSGEHSTLSKGHDDSGDEDDSYFSAEEDGDGQDPRAKILSVVELEEMFLQMAPDLSSKYLRCFSTM